jgi:hypothetical protein
VSQADVTRREVNDDLELSAQRADESLERADLHVVLAFEA